VARYPDGASLMADYSPDKISLIMAITDQRRIFLGQAPELAVVSKLYGQKVTLSWLQVMLVRVNEYAGVKEKLSVIAMQDMANMITGMAWYLRMSEMMLFFAYLMSGRYGKFYGAIDPVAIGDALWQFLQYRTAQMEYLERQDEERQRAEKYEQWRAESVTYEEYRARRVEEG